MTMTLHIFPFPAEFLEAARSFFEADEPAASLIYGVALRLVQAPEQQHTRPYMVLASEAGQVHAAGLMTPPLRLILHTLGEPDFSALDLIAENLTAENWHVPGVLAPSAAAELFSAAYAHRNSVGRRARTIQRLYCLRQLIRPRPVNGAIRLARPEEVDLVAEWIVHFHRDAFGEKAAALEAYDSALRRVLAGEVHLLETSGRVVSMAGISRQTPHGGTISGVYTPPEYRGQGYASALTAALCEKIFASGRQFACLFADLTNPISNHIYQALGFKKVADFKEILFR